MAKVITFSRHFPSYHPKAGQPTFFIEKIWEAIGIPDFSNNAAVYIDLNTLEPRGHKFHQNDILNEAIKNFYRGTIKHRKIHTVRAGHRWKAGEMASPRVWSDTPYRSKQIIIAPDVKIHRTIDFKMDLNGVFSLEGKYLDNELYEPLAVNDGLNEDDMFHWLMPNYNKPKEFVGQILCFTEDQLPY